MFFRVKDILNNYIYSYISITNFKPIIKHETPYIVDVPCRYACN